MNPPPRSNPFRTPDRNMWVPCFECGDLNPPYARCLRCSKAQKRADSNWEEDKTKMWSQDFCLTWHREDGRI